MKKLAALFGVAGAVGLFVFLWSLTERLNSVEARLEQLGRGIDTVSLTLGRALGRELLVLVPPNVEADIREVEDRLGTDSKWPTSPDGVRELNERLDRAVGSLPPWAQEELLPRLLPRRWEVSALWIDTNPAPMDAEGLSRYVSALEEHLASQPAGAATGLRTRLEARKAAGESTLRSLERAAAVEGARKAIHEKKDLAGAARLLAAYEDAEAKELAKQLDELLTVHAINEAVATLESDLESARKLPDPALKVYALARANQATMELRLRASRLSDQGQMAIASLRALEKRIPDETIQANRLAREREAQRLKEYQVWALEQIKKVQTFKDLDKGRSTRDAQALLRRQLIDHLSAIDQRLLDEAVGQWFRKVYQDRFEKLGHDDQLEVVTSFAGTVKRQPD